MNLIIKSEEHYNARTIGSPTFGNDEVRFTTNGNILNMFVLNPSSGKIEIPSLGFNSKQNKHKIKSIRMIGSDQPLEFKQKSDKLILKVPEEKPNKYALVYKIEGLL